MSVGGVLVGYKYPPMGRRLTRSNLIRGNIADDE